MMCCYGHWTLDIKYDMSHMTSMVEHELQKVTPSGLLPYTKLGHISLDLKVTV